MSKTGLGEVAEFSHLRIAGFHTGKWRKHFQPWRRALSDMTGSEVQYGLASKIFLPHPGRHELLVLGGLQQIEAVTASGTWTPAITSALRRGEWETPPDDPLLVILFLSLPGGVFFARHAQAIAQRLEEVEPLIEQLDASGDYGWDLFGMHLEAKTFFKKQAVSGEDVAVGGDYLSRAGDFQFSEVTLSW